MKRVVYKTIFILLLCRPLTHWQSVRLNKNVERKDLQTRYAIQTDTENSWQGIWEHTWACGDADKQTETHNHFSTDPLTQQSFHGNHGLVSPKQHSARGEPNKQFSQTYSEVQSHQRRPALPSPSRPPWLRLTYQPAISNLSHTQRLPAVKWD